MLFHAVSPYLVFKNIPVACIYQLSNFIVINDMNHRKEKNPNLGFGLKK